MSYTLNLSQLQAKLIQQRRKQQRDAKIKQLKIKRLAQENNAKIKSSTNFINSPLDSINQLNIIDSLEQLLFYSQSKENSNSILKYTQNLIDLLPNQNQQKKEKLLKILLNLSQLDDFQMPQDTETIYILLNSLSQIQNSRLVFSIFSNYMNRQQSCPNVVYHILQSGLIGQIKKGIEEGIKSYQYQICEFLCAIARTRPLLQLPILKQINLMIRDIVINSKQQSISDEVSYYLSDYYNIKQNEQLAEFLLCTFSSLIINGTFKKSEIFYFIYYIARHTSLQHLIINNNQLVQYIENAILQSNTKKLALQVLNLLLDSKHNVVELVSPKLLDHITMNFDKTRFIQQVIVLQIVSKYVLNLCQEDNQVKIPYQILKLLKICLLSDINQFIDKSLDVLIKLVFITSNPSMINKFRQILETLQIVAKLPSNTQYSIQHLLSLCDEDTQN